MAKVRSFILNELGGVPDNFIAAFITDCESQHFVKVDTVYIPYPSPRITVIVTKSDTKSDDDRTLDIPRDRREVALVEGSAIKV